MIDLFATLGISIVTTTLLVLEFLSLAILVVGLLSYRHIVASHTAFFDSLHHVGKQARQKSVHVLFWFYLLSTLFLILFFAITYIWQPTLF